MSIITLLQVVTYFGFQGNTSHDFDKSCWTKCLFDLFNYIWYYGVNLIMITRLFFSHPTSLIVNDCMDWLERTFNDWQAAPKNSCKSLVTSFLFLSHTKHIADTAEVFYADTSKIKLKLPSLRRIQYLNVEEKLWWNYKTYTRYTFPY